MSTSSRRLAVLVFCILTAAPAFANPAHDMLSKMSESQRQTAFAALLTKGGERCASVTKTFFQGSDKQGNAFWNVGCEHGSSWAVQVNNDSHGSTRIMDCKMLKAVNAGQCFTKFK